MMRFVDEEDIDSRYWEKPYYLVPDGDEADEGYAIMHRALAETGKVAIGQLIMGGQAHLVGIKALKGGLMLSILRYTDELRDFTPYFEGINTKAEPEAVELAKELIEAESGRFEPEKIPDNMPKPCVSCSALRSSSERLKSRLRKRARQSRKSSTSWRRLSRACRQRDAPRC
jgi:DNA end-binding protein Ku